MHEGAPTRARYTAAQLQMRIVSTKLVRSGSAVPASDITAVRTIAVSSRQFCFLILCSLHNALVLFQHSTGGTVAELANMERRSNEENNPCPHWQTGVRPPPPELVVADSFAGTQGTRDWRTLVLNIAFSNDKPEKSDS